MLSLETNSELSLIKSSPCDRNFHWLTQSLWRSDATKVICGKKLTQVKKQVNLMVWIIDNSAGQFSQVTFNRKAINIDPVTFNIHTADNVLSRLKQSYVNSES